mmetsp:Transcript_17569/g.35655  ORF Transcript_17569/g.35655 Transcript_17569/m.35655 type:complete len:233 (+) Transcript_17569:172-870(+)
MHPGSWMGCACMHRSMLPKVRTDHVSHSRNPKIRVHHPGRASKTKSVSPNVMLHNWVVNHMKVFWFREVALLCPPAHSTQLPGVMKSSQPLNAPPGEPEADEHPGVVPESRRLVSEVSDPPLKLICHPIDGIEGIVGPHGSSPDARRGRGRDGIPPERPHSTASEGKGKGGRRKKTTRRAHETHPTNGCRWSFPPCPKRRRKSRPATGRKRRGRGRGEGTSERPSPSSDPFR